MTTLAEIARRIATTHFTNGTWPTVTDTAGTACWGGDETPAAETEQARTTGAKILERGDRVYVTQLGTDGPFGNATITAFGTDGTGNHVVTVMLDEYTTIYATHTPDETDHNGRSLCEWVVTANQLRKIEG